MHWAYISIYLSNDALFLKVSSPCPGPLSTSLPPRATQASPLHSAPLPPLRECLPFPLNKLPLKALSICLTIWCRRSGVHFGFLSKVCDTSIQLLINRKHLACRPGPRITLCLQVSFLT